MIYSDTREAYIEHVRSVLARLQAYSLFYNLKKYKFFVTKVDFLGFIIGTVGVSIDLRKVDTITK
jgi:hypothetical protein